MILIVFRGSGVIKFGGGEGATCCPYRKLCSNPCFSQIFIDVLNLYEFVWMLVVFSCIWTGFQPGVEVGHLHGLDVSLADSRVVVDMDISMDFHRLSWMCNDFHGFHGFS